MTVCADSSAATKSSFTAEPPLEVEKVKKESDILKSNVQRFVDALMLHSYSLQELLNKSFSLEMLESVLKRMTAKLRMILFSRERIIELISIAFDETAEYHTRTLATSFLILGNAASSLMACSASHNCYRIWDVAFSKLHHQESLEPRATMNEKDTARQESMSHRVSVNDMEEMVQAELYEIQKFGAHSRKMSFLEDHLMTQMESSHAEENWESNERQDAEERLLFGSHHSRGCSEHSDSSHEMENEYQDLEGLSVSKRSTQNKYVLDESTASFASQILQYFAVRGERGGCILNYLAYGRKNETDVAKTISYTDLLLDNIAHDGIRVFLLHLCYSDHSEKAIEALFDTQLLEKLVNFLITFSPPRDVFERDTIENSFLLLREMLHAPYLTSRGVAISAKTIPIDRITGQDEYVSICGASREAANSRMRKYTSRKVRHIVHLCMTNKEFALSSLFRQMIKELTFWSEPLSSKVDVKRRASVLGDSATVKDSIGLLSEGVPRPACATILSHLFELTETVEIAEAAQQNGTNAKLEGKPSKWKNHSLAAAIASGIDCANLMCTSHLVYSGQLLRKKKLMNDVQACQVYVNCMMGIQIATLRDNSHRTDDTDPKKRIGDAITQIQKGNQITIALEDIDSVESSDWHAFGFAIKQRISGHADENKLFRNDRAYLLEDSHAGDCYSIEYLAANSEQEKQNWIVKLQAVIAGDLNELEIFCNDDWRSSVKEYRRLRECLITEMERQGHELIVFLKQVVIQKSRRAPIYHLWSIAKFLNAVVSNESRRLDRMFVSSGLLDLLLICIEQYSSCSLLLSEISKILIFFIGDFKGKRSRQCIVVERLLATESPTAKLLPMLERVFQGSSATQVKNDAFSNLKLILEAIKICYKDPKTRSQLRIQTILSNSERWQKLLSNIEEQLIKDPTMQIISIPIAVIPDNSIFAVSSRQNSDRASSSSVADAAAKAAADVAAAVPSQPAFHDTIIQQITRPSYSSAYGFGSSFVEGDGCVFGYLFQERSENRGWQKALVVYEYVSYKLWYFYPGDVDESHRITWKWIIPLSVKARYTHGQDENYSSIGHHGLFVIARGREANASWSTSKDKSNGQRELHFSATRLEDRDQWKDILSKAVCSIHELSENFSSLACKLKRPDKHSVTHCYDCRIAFKLFRRPHGCHRCGKWLCGKCSSFRKAIPEGGIMRPVRHCQACFEAAGGADADIEPVSLFRSSSLSAVKKVMDDKNAAAKKLKGMEEKALKSTQSSENLHLNLGSTSVRSPVPNLDLFEMAHGIQYSDQSFRRNYRRHDSIDSPTSAFSMNAWNNLEIDDPNRAPSADVNVHLP